VDQKVRRRYGLSRYLLKLLLRQALKGESYAATRSRRGSRPLRAHDACSFFLLASGPSFASKGRSLESASRGSRHPGDIIPVWWATSFRNGERLAPESARWDGASTRLRAVVLRDGRKSVNIHAKLGFGFLAYVTAAGCYAGGIGISSHWDRHSRRKSSCCGDEVRSEF
jgi:hypothetical protein